jgi:thiamine-phosphate pyrophosphorylase
LELAQHIRPALDRTKFIVNGHLDVAIAAGADGVHLQRGNLPVGVVRDAFPGLLIGYSAHSIDEIMDAEKQGADYVLASPVFQPLSKESALTPIGQQTLQLWVRNSKIPVFGLGGITENNLKMISDAGCAGAAGISLFIKNGIFSNERMLI